MNRVLTARRRYAELRGRLDLHCERDRRLHDELTRTIRSLDLKLGASGAEAGARAAETPAGEDRAGGGDPSCRPGARR